MVSLAIRLVIIVLLEAFPPGSPPSAIRFVPGVVFEDETYYLDTARWLAVSMKALQGADLSNPYERVAAYFALAHSVGGEETLWGRILNALIGSLTPIVIYDLLRRSIGFSIKKWAWWFAACSPVLVIWSAFYLKEGLLTLGVALIVNAIVRIHTGRFHAMGAFIMIMGVVVCLWVRSVLIVPLLAPFAVAILVPKKGALLKFLSFLFVSITIFIWFCLTIIAPMEVVETISPFFKYRGLGVILESVTMQERGVEVTFPFFSVVMSWSGPLRIVGFTFLLMLSPVITSLWSLLPFVGRPSWYAFAVAAYAASWWICLPFWIRATYDALRKRDTWWLVLGGGFILWSMVAAFSRFGAGYDAFRWRDAMVPVIMLLAAKGLETTLSQRQRKGAWPIWLKGYWLFVVALILMRGLGILRLT